jgi:uncharacterized zinc-type alcohol dehydrogenase-like protein
MLGRRQFVVAGLGFAAAPLLPGIATGAEAGEAAGEKLISIRAYGASSASTPLAAMQIQRRALRPNDVLLDVLYCGICHSDIHQVRDEWASWVRPGIPAFQAMRSSVACRAWGVRLPSLRSVTSEV